MNSSELGVDPIRQSWLSSWDALWLLLGWRRVRIWEAREVVFVGFVLHVFLQGECEQMWVKSTQREAPPGRILSGALCGTAQEGRQHWEMHS